MSFSNEQQGGTQHSDSFARLTIGESGGPERNLMKGSGSSVSSAESMRSDKSRDGPPNLTGEGRNLMKGPGSSVSSAESMRSNKSRDGPPNLTGEGSLKSMSSGYASSVSASSVSSGREQCDACTKTAVKRCLTCDSYFCITHVDDHYKTPELQKHDLQDLQYHSLSEQHHRELELYCTTDQSPICLQCLLHNHRGNEVIEQSPRRTKEGVSPSVPSPGPIKFPSVQSESVSLSWSPPESAPNYNTFRVTWSGGRKRHSITVEGLDLEVTELIPGEKYHFAVSTLSDDDSQSPHVVRSVHTAVPPPVNLSVDLKLLSAFLAWTKPAGVDQVSYLLVLLRDQKRIATIHRNSPHYTITEIKHGEDYNVSVSTVLVNGRQSKPTSTIFRPEIPFPEDLAVSSITRSSAFLCWLVSAEMQQAPHSFLVSYQSKGTEPQSIYTEACSTDITSLKAGTEYTVRVYTVLQNGERSQPASLQMRTEIPVPECLTVSSITTSSANLRWKVSPEMEQIPHRFLVSYQSEGTEPKLISVKLCSQDLTGLSPGTQYTVRVYTELQHDGKSQPASLLMRTKIPVPECLTVSSITTSSANLRWKVSPEMEQIPHRFLVSYQSEGTEPKFISVKLCSQDLTGLSPGTQYTVRVYTELQHDGKSQPASLLMRTKIPVPECLTVSSITTSSAILCWKVSPEMEQIPHRFLVSYQSEGTEPKFIHIKSHSQALAGLKPGTEYTVRVYTELQHGRKGQPASLQIRTENPVPAHLTVKPGTTAIVRVYTEQGDRSHSASFQMRPGENLSDVLSVLHLEKYKGGKLSLSSVLEINRNTFVETPECLEQLPWCFLKRLMSCQPDARHIKCQQQNVDVSDYSDPINPLDLIVALLHCSDPFLQQEMVSKMSMCQFAVPLLLPNCDTHQSTLMLWAMRDIVKKFRPHPPAGDKPFVEGRIVEMDIPMISFIRLGGSSLPKSQILNMLLSTPHQHNGTFVQPGVGSGDVRISDGLVELSWYLPFGNPKNDIFTYPVAIANMRGDGKLFKTEISFLCQTSAAVFIFSDELGGDLSCLNSKELFWVTNCQGRNFNGTALADTCKKYNIGEKNVIRYRQNDADLIKSLCQHINGLMGKNPRKMKVEDMKTVACVGRIQVDEDSTDCIAGRQRAKQITKSINDVVQFKETHLPLHGDLWKGISQLEKEMIRLRRADRMQSIENYKSSLIQKIKELRAKQQQKGISNIMDMFINGLSLPDPQRLHFLKWLEIELETLTRPNLSTLRKQYRSCAASQNRISHIDEQISKYSLGLEHFVRELGQFYESNCSLPENDPGRKEVQHLPALCAQILLDGFPVELVDGDSSNIPMKWISELMIQLHKLVDSKSRMLVLSVLGVQGTGKSTLLNTMFGVQFAVSSGRCTRGAFMQLIKVSEEFRSQLKCDFIMVIDTEGLKSPELAELDTSYEHDNELATLVMGLSDITIVNISTENPTEMKDVLQIVAQAFLRMGIEKRPKCVFVHTVLDMAATDIIVRDRKNLLKELDAMTQIAAKMEKKEGNTKFTDVIDYDPDTDSYNIPKLCPETPTKAPVNASYSDAVYQLKKSLIGFCLPKGSERNDLTTFLKWTEQLWNAVKLENFIFNFRNSLVADVYSDLWRQYNTWELSFQKEINKWLVAQAVRMSGLPVNNTFLNTLYQDLNGELHKEQRKIIRKLDTYFQENNSSQVPLEETYREHFRMSAMTLRKETEHSVKHSLGRIVGTRKGKEEVTKIRNKVLELIKNGREKRVNLSGSDLTKEFEKMWTEITAEVTVISLSEIDVYADVLHQLRVNFSSKSGKVSDMLNRTDLRRCGDEHVVSDSNYGFSLQTLLSAIMPIDSYRYIQNICNVFIRQCVSNMEKNNTDYHGTYIKDILNTIDDHVKHHPMTDECEANLKFHVCGTAARVFQEKHREFIAHNDPQKCLLETKNTLRKTFFDSFWERYEWEKVFEFVETCVKPAVQDYVSRHLEQAIINEIMTVVGYSLDCIMRKGCSSNLQFAILKQLLDENSFEKYKEYTRSYETYFNNWIKQVIQTVSGESMELTEENLLHTTVTRIIHTITRTSKDKDIHVFIQQFCFALQDHLVFPRDVLETFTIHIHTKTDQFATKLEECIKGRKKDIIERIAHLPFKLHELLYSRLCGCEHQCPFCGAPCEGGVQEHSPHFSTMHQPQAFFGHSQKLKTGICTTLVFGNKKFETDAAKGKCHEYRKYNKVYPDWDIPGSPEVSDYWKYVMMKFNKRLAEDGNKKPANIPSSWEKITPNDALRSLRQAFNVW